jgi:hypothetical protein
MPKVAQPLMRYAQQKHIYSRFVFWTEKKRRRLDDVLKILQYEEVFLTEQVILRAVKSFKKDHEMELRLKKELQFKEQLNAV